MDAAADYAAAKALMSRTLPAYVSYAVRSHFKFDAIVRDESQTVVVRTSDGTIVKGRIPESAPRDIHIGTDSTAMEPVAHPAFQASCYAASGAHLRRYEGRELEAIALRETCPREKGDQDFDTLYVEATSHAPVAALGTNEDGGVAVRLVQGFTLVQDRALPSSLFVSIHGSGFMAWLDLVIDQQYSAYRFTSTPP